MAASSGFMNIFMKGDDYTQSSGNLNLSITGNTAGTEFDYDLLPLLMEAEPFNTSMNIYMMGIQDTQSINSSINLYLHGRGEPANNSLDMVIWGSSAEYPISVYRLTQDQLYGLTLDQLDQMLLDGDVWSGFYSENSINLSITGDGISEHFIPEEDNMNLVLWGDKAANAFFNIFLQAPTQVENNLNLYMPTVSGILSNSLDLYMDSIGYGSGTMKLFIRGYTT